jgi:hypothetical protein
MPHGGVRLEPAMNTCPEPTIQRKSARMSTIATTTGENIGTIVGILLAIVLHFGPVVVCVLKGKYPTAAIGVLFGIFALVGMIRLAKPGSFYWRRYYEAVDPHNGRHRDAEKMRRSRERFPKHAAKLDATAIALAA